MVSYRIEWKRSALKDLRQFPRETVARILRAVERLPAEPFPTGMRKLVGTEHTYRIRVGSYRVIYTVTATTLVIEIIKVGHRKDVYDR